MTLEGIINIIGENPEHAVEVLKRWLSEDQDYTGTEKAAVLISSVNIETASKIYCYLSKEEMEKIAIKVAQLEKIDVKNNNSDHQKLLYLKNLRKTNSVLREFDEKLKARLYGNNSDYANKVLGAKKP
jgi:flagellar motor switch protein FliG